MDFTQLGDEAKAAQRWAEATKWYSKKLKAFPGDYDTQLKLGEVLQLQGLFGEAINLYKTCLNKKPDAVWLYGKIGRAYYHQGSNQDAILAYQCGLAIGKKNFNLQRQLARIYISIGSAQEAQIIYDQALKIWPKKPELLFDLAVFSLTRGNAGQAMQHYQLLSDVCQHSPKHLCMTAGFEMRYLEDYESALEKYNSAVGIENECVEAYDGIAHILLALGRLSEAETRFKHLKERFPHDPKGFCGLAKVWEREAKLKLALDCWLKITDRFPHHHDAFKQSAKLQSWLGLFPESRDTYTSMCQIFPHMPSGLEGLVELAQMSQDYDLALETCDRLLKEFPRHLGGYLKRAIILLRIDRLSDAEEFLKHNLKEDINLTKALRTLYSVARDASSTLLHATKLHESLPCLDTYIHLLHATLQSGEIGRLEPLLDKVFEPTLFVSKHRVFALLQHLSRLAKEGAIDDSWSLFQSVVTLYSQTKTLRLGTFKHDRIILSATSLILLRAYLNLGRLNHASLLVNLIETFHGFALHPWLLSCAYNFLGSFYHENSRNKQAISYFQKSLALNPESIGCIQQIKRVLREDFCDVAKKLFSNQTTGPALMIISCRANAHKLSYVRDNYYRSLRIPYCFVIGDPSLGREWEAEDDILYIRCPDNYESLSEKVLKAFHFFCVFTDFSGVLKLDDDCAVASIEDFREKVLQAFSNPLHDFMGKICRPPVGRAWHFGKCADADISLKPYSLPHQTEWCGGGEAYFLSRRSLETLFEYTTKYQDVLLGELYEDVFIASCLFRCGIKPVNYALDEAGFVLVDSINSHGTSFGTISAETLFANGLQYVAAGKYQLAIDAFRTALMASHDQPPELFSALADALSHEDLVEEAISALLVGTSRFPDCPKLSQQFKSLMSSQDIDTAGLGNLWVTGA